MTSRTIPVIALAIHLTRRLRWTAIALGALVLAACASTPEQTARTFDPSDPWGIHIADAAERFDIPEAWIREVMWVESRGQTHLYGGPTTSHAGAMGLMQVMPGTWRELASRYNLGDDPHDPRDNIMAGAAYIREMYELFGAPGFLAAYNAGPGRYRQHVEEGRPLPPETVTYMAMIAPRIAGESPSGRGVQPATARPAVVYASLPTPQPTPLPTPAAASVLASSATLPPRLPVGPGTAGATTFATASTGVVTPATVRTMAASCPPGTPASAAGIICPNGGFTPPAVAPAAAPAPVIAAALPAPVPASLPTSRPALGSTVVAASAFAPVQPTALPAYVPSTTPGVLGYLPAGTVLPRPVYAPSVTNELDSLIQAVNNQPG